MSTTLDALVVALAGQVSRSVLRQQDVGYESARAVHNGLINRKLALIVRCRTTCDVVAALECAGPAGLDVSIRGGGHNVAGRAVSDGGVMIDLAGMKRISIDPEQATATVEGGVVWGELNDAAAEHGLAVTGGAVSGTGVAGYAFGGGLGWLMAKYGRAADNLVAVELITAEGDVLWVDARSRPDLFWALRRGGGNFGVATSFTFRLHPVRMVVGGSIVHPIDAATELLRFYRGAVAGSSDDLTVFAGLVHARDGSGVKLSAHVVFHTGAAAEAEREFEPFKTWGSPLVVDVGPMSYSVMNTLLDEGFPSGSLNHWLSSFTRGLPDEESGAADSAAPGQLSLRPLLHPFACVKEVDASWRASRQRTSAAHWTTAPLGHSLTGASSASRAASTPGLAQPDGRLELLVHTPIVRLQASRK